MTTHGVSGFNGRTALVTGAGSGIGEAVARRLAQAGANVVVADINEAEAARVAQSIGGKAWARRLDVSDESAVGALVDAIVGRYGALDMAVNNAGIGAWSGMLHQESLENWRRTMSINLDGVFYCLRNELRVMAERKAGAIVNMASILGQVGVANAVSYVASKHAVVGMTKAAALDYAPLNIRINAVCPGFIETRAVQAASVDHRQALAAKHPVGRLGSVEEVAELTAFLLSDQASFITGSAHLVDGAYVAQ